jgi:hypothetical protein
MRSTIVSLAFVLLMTANARPQGSKDIVYLSEFLKDPEYRFAYNRMITVAGGLPTWLRRYNASGDGQYEPTRIYKSQGRSYQLSSVCRPRGPSECLYVLFSMDRGPVAWGYLVTGGQGTWIGNPPLEAAEKAEMLVVSRQGLE